MFGLRAIFWFVLKYNLLEFRIWDCWKTLKLSLLGRKKVISIKLSSASGLTSCCLLSLIEFSGTAIIPCWSIICSLLAISEMLTDVFTVTHCQWCPYFLAECFLAEYLTASLWNWKGEGECIESHQRLAVTKISAAGWLLRYLDFHLTHPAHAHIQSA